MTAEDVPASAAERLRGCRASLWLDGMFCQARFQTSTTVSTTTSVWFALGCNVLFGLVRMHLYQMYNRCYAVVKIVLVHCCLNCLLG
ncbi:hypothetical protein CEXT_544291 [Caerostris extrusa]|uniref:Uncharacterized protein n=1 Tax=Caerostris extrusa TaxID=172846 RepID=A0AAV4Q8A8_CAEEX|nr:hypothetical protein CEXT_544291 [Caerostris extrusa]